MRAVTVRPGDPSSLKVAEVPAPSPEGVVLVETLLVGVCGTDLEIVLGGHGEAPGGRDELVLGHEAVGRVLRGPPGTGVSEGDLVVPIVRRPDPVPCECCSAGRWDMCRNGLYTECGIKGRDGFASEVFAVEPSFVVVVPEELGERAVLTEPASVVAKAWRRIHASAEINCLTPQRVLVAGAGPIGLLAALLGVQAGLDVHVLDLATSGPKPELVRRLGAAYHTAIDECPETDVVVECTGAPSLVFQVVLRTARNGIVCLTGVSEHAEVELDAGAINRELVLHNDVVIGSVNAARDDYLAAVTALGRADPGWLDDLMTRKVPVERCADAYERRPGDVKTVLTFEGTPPPR